MRGHFKAMVDHRDGRRCAICGSSEPQTHIGRHHILPRKEGGRDTIENVVTLCKYHHELADNEKIPREQLFSVVSERNKRLMWGDPIVKKRRNRKEKVRAKTDPKKYRNSRRRAYARRSDGWF